MIKFTSQLSKAEFITFILTAVSTFFCIIATLTPSWQVAEDVDAHRNIKSGLWIYCTEGMQCWYIFSDTLINYYERVDVCRFLLIYDCRKKLLRTPYFFGWHYAILILMLITIFLCASAMVSIGVAHFRRRNARVAVIALDACISLAFLLLCIALAVFMINAEMLESRFLIGIKNTFEKSYGFSFYMACIGLTILILAVMGAVFITTSVFFLNGIEIEFSNMYGKNNDINDNMYNYDATKLNDMQTRKYKMIQEAQLQLAKEPSVDTAFGSRYCYSPDMSIPTRTFLSY